MCFLLTATVSYSLSSMASFLYLNLLKASLPLSPALNPNIEITGSKVSEFKFQKLMEEPEVPEEKVFRIDVKYIVLVILGVILLVGLGFGIYHLADNFYLIRYKIESRRQRIYYKVR